MTNWDFFESQSVPVPKRHVAQVAAALEKADGTSTGIDYNKPPKNFADVMSRKDAAEWMETYWKEYQGLKDRDAVRVVIPPQGTKVLGSTTRIDYEVKQGVLQK